MANEEHLAILRQGVDVWNAWRNKHFKIWPDLSRANLNGADLSGADLSGAALSGAALRRANLRRADLSRADLIRADLSEADLNEADVIRANLSEADLVRADLSGANLSGADLSKADLSGADLSGADLSGANLSRADLLASTLRHAFVGATLFANLDFRTVIGLDILNHTGPSTVGIDTLYRSGGRIPEAFLRGCGVPESLIGYQRSLVGAEEVIQYYACVISYSAPDTAFAQRLYSRMRDERMRIWYAPEDLKGGEKLLNQIDEAIRVFDKVIVVLSEASLGSAWVDTEIRKAFRAERTQGKRKLFPIRLMPFEALEAWDCFDGGHDLAAQLRALFIPDFSAWKDHDAYEAAFAKLLRDLRA